MFLTLEASVRDICNAIGDTEAKQFARMARIFKNELRSLNLLVLPTGVRTIRGQVSDAMSFNLDADIVKVDSVAMNVGNGRLATLRNMDITAEDSMATCTCSSVQQPEPSLPGYDGACLMHTYWGVGPFGGWLWGAYSPKVAGGWMWDQNNNRVLFSGLSVGTNVVLNIRSSKGELELIPVQAYKMLEAKTLKTFYASSNPNVSSYWGSIFASELHYYKEQANPWDFEQVYDAIYGSARRAKN